MSNSQFNKLKLGIKGGTEVTLKISSNVVGDSNDKNNFLRPLGLTAAVSATDAAIHKKMFGSGKTTLIISNEEMNDIMKKIKSLEESGLLKKDVTETIKLKRGFSVCY